MDNNDITNKKGKYMIKLIILSLFLISCTYSINMVHTQGEATDVIDETSANTPNISPEISTPLIK